MKRSISINLSGLLFHIEEDAYERLSHYLNEIKAYFNRIDASGEVVQDIESRMAEVFTQKVGPAKQVITTQDVEQLIAQLGSVQDFAAAYGDEPISDTAYEVPPRSQTAYTGDPEDKKLYRDASQKILGGVASGIARYLKIDAIWVRLLLVIIMFDFFLTFSFSTLTFISYIVLWIALPEKFYPKEEPGKEKTKKMYRNPDNKVIGGVAGGLGAYFGTDPTLLRILFVVLFFVGGGGLLLYIILWVIMPEARTLTEKMRMQGEPVTLTNIEHQVKKKLNLPENEQESVLTRILLFPFRLISAIFSGSGNGARSVAAMLGRLIRIVVGLFLAFLGFVLLVALLASILALAGAYPGWEGSGMEIDNIPIEWIRTMLPPLLWVAIGVLLVIPALFVLLAGIAFLASGWRMPREIGWSLAGLWIVALVVTLAMLPGVISKFDTKGYHTSTLTLASPDSAQVLNLRLDDKPFRKAFNIQHDNFSLTIRGSEDSVIVIEQQAAAFSQNQELAQELAAGIPVPVRQEGNTVWFTCWVAFNEKPEVLLQEVELVMYIPTGQRFTMSRELGEILNNTLYPHDYSVRDLGNRNIFYYNQYRELVCENCPTERPDNDRDRRRNYSSQSRSFQQEEDARFADSYTNVDRLEISGALEVYLRQGDRVEVAYAGRELDFRRLEIEQRGETLEISRGLRWNRNDDDEDDVVLYLTVPNVDMIRVSGASTLRLDHVQTSPLELVVNGASEVLGKLEAEALTIQMSGASEIQLEGRCQRLQADVSAGSTLTTDELEAEEVNIEMSTGSEASVYARQRLEAKVNSGSELGYQGSPNYTNFNTGSGGEITRRD